MKLVEYFFPKPKPKISSDQFQKSLDEVFLNERNYIDIAERAEQRGDAEFAMEIYTKFYKKIV